MDKWNTAIQTDPDYHAQDEHIFVMEYIKTLLKNKQYKTVLAFVDANFDKVLKLIQDFMIEARVIALYQLGCTNEALELTRQYSSEGLNLHKVIFQIRQAEILLLTEEKNQALEVANKTAFTLAKIQFKHSSKTYKLLLAHRLVKLLAELGNKELALQIARSSYRGAIAAKDEYYEFDFLMAIVELETDQEASYYPGLRKKASRLVDGIRPLEDMPDYKTNLQRLETLFEQTMAAGSSQLVNL